MANEKALERTFRISVALKGLDGGLEVLGGALLLFLSPASINHIVRALTAHELAQEPTDYFARHLLHAANQLSPHTTLYGAIYLLAHGVAKVVLVSLVLRDKLWAYPWMIALLLAFIVYQGYQLTMKFSLALTLLTLFDAFVVVLTWREFRTKHAAAVLVGAG